MNQEQTKDNTVKVFNNELFGSDKSVPFSKSELIQFLLEDSSNKFTPTDVIFHPDPEVCSAEEAQRCIGNYGLHYYGSKTEGKK